MGSLVVYVVLDEKEMAPIENEPPKTLREARW